MQEFLERIDHFLITGIETWISLTGNNLFGGDIKKKLLELKEGSTDDSFAAYILMQRIFPPVHITYMLRNGKLTAQGAVSELGIFATYVRWGTITNKYELM